MYSHHKSCGWSYCVLIEDAWKYSVTLKTCSAASIDYTLDDYLIIECETKDAAEILAECIGTDIPDKHKVSVWNEGLPAQKVRIV